MNKDLTKTNLPTLTPEGSFASYLSKIRKFPMLDAAEEYMLAKNWRDKGDKDAAHKLVTSHLRLDLLQKLQWVTEVMVCQLANLCQKEILA